MVVIIIIIIIIIIVIIIIMIIIITNEQMNSEPVGVQAASAITRKIGESAS